MSIIKIPVRNWLIVPVSDEIHFSKIGTDTGTSTWRLEVRVEALCLGVRRHCVGDQVPVFASHWAAENLCC